MSDTPTTSQTWLQNFRLNVNGEKVRWPDYCFNLAAGQCIELMLEFEHSYLIGDPDSPLKLCCDPDAETLGLMSDPPFGQLIEIAEGLVSLTWNVCSGQNSNAAFGLTFPFELHFEMPLYQGMPHSPVMSGAIVDSEQQLELYFDRFPVSFGSRVYPCHGARHTVKVQPKNTSHLIGKRVELKWGGTPAAELGVVIHPNTPQMLTLAGAVWELKCESSIKDGSFFLNMEVESSEGVTEPLFMSLGHNRVTAERWTTGPFQLDPVTTYYFTHIRATSLYTALPAQGVEVLVNGVGGSSTTGLNGEVREQVLKGTTKNLSIINRYDGGTV